MKPSALQIERMLAEAEAALVQPPRKWLLVIIHEGDDGALARERTNALAEHVARHPEDVGRTVEDFNWIVHEIVHVHQVPEMAAKMLEYQANGNGRRDRQ